jgi:hypothetical protein
MDMNASPESRALGIFPKRVEFRSQPWRDESRDAHGPYILVQLLSHGLPAQFLRQPDVCRRNRAGFCADAWKIPGRPLPCRAVVSWRRDAVTLINEFVTLAALHAVMVRETSS